MNSLLSLLFVCLTISSCDSLQTEENAVEARGKGKYALLTHLAIILAAKFGLFKLFLGIAIVVTAVKIMVVMAWLLAISEHAPVHFFYVAATKLIVLKIIYGFLFYAIAVKAWHFMLWFVHYIKKKKSLDQYIEFDHEQVYDHGHYGLEYGNYDHLPYGLSKPGYGDIDSPYNKKIYDADGSYSVVGL